MSLFGSLMRDMEQDPIFGPHQRAMNRMMSSMFPGGGAFPGLNMDIGGGPPGMMRQTRQHDELMPFGGGMMSPFGAFGGFPDLSNMFNGMAPTNGLGHGFSSSSSSFVSISSGPDGRPQVYQASSQTRQGPDGLRETRKAVQDSRSGTKKMAVGRHMGERGHVVEREQNVRTGQLNENHEFYNLEEEEAPHFDREWRSRANQALGGRYAHSASMPAIGSSSHASLASNASRSSYVEQPEEEQGVYQPAAIGYQPHHSQSSVTIEELPASDEEEAEPMQPQQSRAASRRNYASASVAAASAPSSSRGSPYGTTGTKEKRQKRSRTGKKY